MRKVSVTFITVAIMFLGTMSSVFAENDENSIHRDRLFNSGWKFVRDSLQGPENPEYDDSGWMTVDLPHDYSILNLPGEDGQEKIGPFSKKSPGNGNSTGHVIGGTGWYRKSFTLEKADEGKTVIINFDGIYMESEVWVNGFKAGIHKNGYTPFWYDITPLLNPSGKVNVIAVKVENTGRNSRWYSGSGIYRNVHLIVTDPVHVVEWGVKITTYGVSRASAVVYAEITAQNSDTRVTETDMEFKVKDKSGREVGRAVDHLQIPSKSNKAITVKLQIKDPLLWSPESPDLYTGEVTLKVNKKITDQYKQTFGIRLLEFSPEKGFLINGNPVKLKGACIHHDNGFLGSAAFERAEERKVEILKTNGYNAVRCSHNPPSSAFLDACDRLGMLVIDEFTDMWEHYKNPQDYSRFFKEWWKKDLTDMIMRDRNHPGIIMWSIGNEVYELEQEDRIRIARQLADCIRDLDSSRAVTQAITEFFFPDGWENTREPFGLMDVCGYNYAPHRYEEDHQSFPKRIIFGSESFPIKAWDYWWPVEKYPWVIGDFVWTGMDYLGEVAVGNSSYVKRNQAVAVQSIPTGFKLPKNMNIFDMQLKRPSAWPDFVSGCGDIDLTGEAKPQKLYRDVLWDMKKIEMNVHAPAPPGYSENISMWGWPDERPSWSWKGNEGKPLSVRVFTKARHVKLELNGKVVGEKDMVVDDRYIATFEVPYQPGELKAYASNNGEEAAVKVLRTTGDPAAIRLVPDRNIIKADRNDLAFVRIEVVDDNEQIVPLDSIPVRLILSGNGEIAASGNANPKDMGSVNKPVINTYKGKGLAVIRPSVIEGNIRITAEAKGLKAGELMIQVTR